jgi:WD40 repeat protein
VSVVCRSSARCDDRWIAAVGGDQIVHLWNRTAQKEARPYVGHHTAVYAAAFSADDKVIASVGEGKAVLLWPLPAETPTQFCIMACWRRASGIDTAARLPQQTLN